MERWAAGRASSRRAGHDHPSFSSTLLDAIYRSIDDECEPGGAKRDDRRCGGAPAPSAVSAAAKSRRSTLAGQKAEVAAAERRESSDTATANRRRGTGGRFPPISTSSSSDNSSYGGFSSSEPETATPHPALRLRPIRTGGAAAAHTRSSGHPATTAAALPPRTQRILPPVAPAGAASAQHGEKKKSSSIRSKLRDLRKSSSPASPGARLAGFINSLFASAAGNPRKQKTSQSMPPAVIGGADESTCSTASSYSRSCLSKTPSSRGPATGEGAVGKRSVRFYPVSVIVGEDLRPCGQKSVYDGGAPPPAAGAARGRREWEAKKRVEELLRGCDDDDDEEEEEGSDSSSDLFELENLTAIGRGTGYRDELPVYETTTYLGPNRPISHNLML